MMSRQKKQSASFAREHSRSAFRGKWALITFRLRAVLARFLPRVMTPYLSSLFPRLLPAISSRRLSTLNWRGALKLVYFYVNGSSNDRTSSATSAKAILPLSSLISIVLDLVSFNYATQWSVINFTWNVYGQGVSRLIWSINYSKRKVSHRIEGTT